ncbi:MAG: hypothetical protein JJU11_00260 [Candidatus Sumerlaeia bacterium]|nr:hypothetical protein [Candidatus Sumerlaeia bacterium]
MKNSSRIRIALMSVLAVSGSTAFALSGSGDSAPGTLDTVAPSPGVASPPAEAQGTPIEITYSGATDGDGSGLALVELWVRTDTASWSFSGLSDTEPAGSFSFTPAGDPGEIDDDYYFTLVAEDTVVNRSDEPEGVVGDGDGTTTLNTETNVRDWMVLDQ